MTTVYLYEDFICMITFTFTGIHLYQIEQKKLMHNLTVYTASKMQNRISLISFINNQ